MCNSRRGSSSIWLCSFLSRWPSAAEKNIAIESLEKYHGQGMEDLAWGLINKVEFVFNY